MRRTFFIRVSRVLVFYRISDTTPQRESKKGGKFFSVLSFSSKFFVFFVFSAPWSYLLDGLLISESPSLLSLINLHTNEKERVREREKKH